MEEKGEEAVKEKGEQKRGTLWGEKAYFKALWGRGSSPLPRPTNYTVLKISAYRSLAQELSCLW